MKVILDISNTLHEERSCIDFMECLEIYTGYLVKYGRQLGICYGLNSLKKFPTPGEYKSKCENGYVEIMK